MRRSLGGLLLLAALVAPPGAAAQEDPRPDPQEPAARFAAAGRLTSLQGRRTGMVGGSVALRLAPRLSVGGAGWLLLRAQEIESATPGPGLRLRVAYGGARLEADLASLAALQVGVAATIGAGNAKAELPAVGTEVASDNFFMVEPELLVRIPLTRHFALFGSGSYRMVGAAEDLPGVNAESLRGASGSLGIVAFLF